MDSSFPGFACVFAIGVFFVIPMWGYTMVTEWYARAARARAIEAGRHEPVTIQPFVDLSVCMGSGACVPACPEDVLKVIEGQAFAVNMASCIGHGACVSACPVGAIELVFGSEKRGIEIPFVGPDFQTNVPGVFIAGELGGMGLIANAAEQGVKAMAHATADLRSDPDLVDVVIVGAGPAGISAAASAKRQGHKYVVLEQDELGGAVRHYPRKKLVFTRPMEIPGYPKVNLKTMRKEELVTLFSDVVDKLGLEVSTRERVDRVERREGRGFRVTTSKRTIEAQRVILALGRRGTPRKLKVDGEQLDKVAYSLLEPEQYKYEHLLIVGGGDSAVEAAVALSEQPGNRVTLSYRGDKINRPKEKNIQYLRDAMKAGKVEVLLESQILGITKDRVTLEQKSEQVVIPNDWVFVMVGGVLPIDFLKAVGIKIERHFGKRVEHIEDPAEVHAAAPPPRPSPTETTAEIPRAQGNEEPTLWLGPVPEFGENGELPYDEVPLEAMNEPSGSLSDGFGVGLGSPLAAEPSEPGVPGLARAFVADAERRRAVGDHRGVVRMAEVYRRAAPSAGPGGAAAAPWIDLVEGEARIALGEG
ncbi:MAG: NAD(P)-binding domain-containing protein, partial [Myxococcota bacterium]